MAVPSYRRKLSEFKILKETQNLMVSLARLYKKEELCPKRYSRVIGEPLMENLRNLIYEITNANSLQLNDEMDERRKCQKSALRILRCIYVDIMILSELNGGNIAKFENQLLLLDSVEGYLKRWIKSDMKRIETQNGREDEKSNCEDSDESWEESKSKLKMEKSKKKSLHKKIKDSEDCEIDTNMFANVKGIIHLGEKKSTKTANSDSNDFNNKLNSTTLDDEFDEF